MASLLDYTNGTPRGLLDDEVPPGLLISPPSDTSVPSWADAMGWWANHMATGWPTHDEAVRSALNFATGFGTTDLAGEAPIGSNLRISTRVPSETASAKAGIDPHSTSELQVGLDSSQASPDAYAKGAQIIAGYPDIPTGRARSPDTITERFLTHTGDNLKYLYDQMPPEIRDRAMQWYDGGRAIADQYADQYSVLPEQVAGTIAALSPRKNWFENVDLARRMLDMHTNADSLATTPETMAMAQRLVDGQKNPTVQAAYQTAVNGFEGKTLGQLEDPVDRALWMQAYDRAHADQGFQLISPEGQFIGPATNQNGSPASVTWQPIPAVAKANSVLADGSLPNISEQMGGNHKIRNFYNNIIAPDSPAGDVTIDTHAIAAAHMRPLSSSSPVVDFGLGTGGPGSDVTGSRGAYGLYAEAYRRAAADLGILPRQLQSVTWEGLRGLFSPAAKRNKGLVSGVDDIWGRFGQGQIDASTARQQITDLAGGIDAPSWWRPPD